MSYRTWGGRRPGAGRKRKPGSGVPHRKRPPLAARFPVHVTLKLTPELGVLRTRKRARIVQQCLLGANAAGAVRIVHFALLCHHLHLIVEAQDREALSRGMKGLGIRLARRLNAAAGRRGQVITDRYHEHILKTPQQVRNALCYVLRNAARHAASRGTDGALAGVDPYSSGATFDGWRDDRPSPRAGPDPPPVVAARTWLLTVGWRRCGLISTAELPGH